MISIKNALSTICNDNNVKLSSERISVLDSLGRVVSENIFSKTDNPSFNMSAMDGYAVCNNPKNGIYKTKGTIFAGQTSKKKLLNNEAVRVFTGSKIPKGTKAIIIQENIKKLQNEFIFNKNRKIVSGQFIRKAGLDFKKKKLLYLKIVKLPLEILPC